MRASDPLLSHTGVDQGNTSASYFLMPQIDNGQGSASTPDLLVSQGAFDDIDMPAQLNIFNRKIIEDLTQTTQTFLYRVHDDNTEEAGTFASLLGTKTNWEKTSISPRFYGIEYK